MNPNRDVGGGGGGGGWGGEGLDISMDISLADITKSYA